MRMHTYQSDWVVLRCDAATKPTLSPDVDGSALGLYEFRTESWPGSLRLRTSIPPLRFYHCTARVDVVMVDAAKVQVIGHIEDAKDNVSSLSALTEPMDQASMDRARRRLLLEASPLQGMGKVAEKVIVRMLKPQAELRVTVTAMSGRCGSVKSRISLFRPILTGPLHVDLPMS